MKNIPHSSGDKSNDFAKYYQPIVLIIKKGKQIFLCDKVIYTINKHSLELVITIKSKL
jgi:hypothetical protein